MSGTSHAEDLYGDLVGHSPASSRISA